MEENATADKSTEDNSGEAKKEEASKSQASGENLTNGSHSNSKNGSASETSPAGGFKYVEVSDSPRSPALEVQVDHSIEKAMKILKRKLIKEGLFKELKMRRYYEKPSERKKRKHKETMKKLRKEEARNRKNSTMF